MFYRPEYIRAQVTSDLDRLLAPWLVGQSPNYVMSWDRRYGIATAYWLDEQLALMVAAGWCSEDDRRTQMWKYNRQCRTYDLFEVAAEVMTEAFWGVVEQNRVGHRRWG